MTDTTSPTARPLEPAVARALLSALNGLPYSGNVDWPGGHHDEQVTAADLAAAISDLGVELRRAADSASDTAARLLHLERDVAGARRLLGLEVLPPQRYVVSTPDAQALRETTARLRAQLAGVDEPVDPSLAGQPITVANAHRHPGVVRP